MSVDINEWDKISHHSTIAFAIEVIRCLMIANGGAVLAILSFLGNSNSEKVKVAVIATSLSTYGTGLALACACAMGAYLAQACFTQVKNRVGIGFQIAAILAAAASLGCFVWASVVASTGFVQ